MNADVPPIIAVLPATLATARNARTAKEYANVQTAVEEAQDGDTIEVSPGDLYFLRNCGKEAPFGGGTNCHLAIRNSIAVKAMDPTKRPVIRPQHPRMKDTGGQDADGIIIGAPWELGGKKLDVTIDGVVIQNLGYDYALGGAILIRNSTLAGWPRSVTVRNAVLASCTAGGVKGSCDSLLLDTIECSDGGDGSGSEHNFYVGGNLVTAKNVHSFRTRLGLDGHILKCRSKKTVIENCNFDNKNGNASAVLQLPNGGELIMRATTLTQGARTANGKGIIWYGDEGNRGAVTGPREDGYNAANWQAWLAQWGAWTHSYDIQGCTFVDHLGKSVLVYFSSASPPRAKSVFTGNTYPATSVPPNGLAPALAVQGFLDAADCANIRGWAWNMINDDSVNVDIYNDDVLLSTVSANVLRQDLKEAGKGNGAHGFNVPTPAILKDGEAHSVTAAVGSFRLINSPRTITCAATVVGVPPVVVSDHAVTTDTSPVSTWPPWRKALALNTVTDISPPGNTAASAYKAAGYLLPGWEGDASDNLSAWGCGILAPNLGKWGGLVGGMNGHASRAASTIYHLDLETGEWVKPICPPQIHRQVAPDNLPPPVDAEIWYYPKSDLRRMWADEAFSSNQATPFSVEDYSFPRWQCRFGLRYATNVPSGMRYDCLSIIPESCGGEAAGTLAIVAPGLSHEYNHWIVGQGYTWRYGLTTRRWLQHSTNQMPERAGSGISATSAFSTKYKKVFTASAGQDDMGVYDPVTNAHSSVKANSDTTAYSVESSAVITEGHAAHLYISLGRARTNNELCLYVVDLDQAVAGRGKAWAILDKGAMNAPYPGRVKLLNRVNFRREQGSLAWAEDQQRLLYFQPPNQDETTGNPPATTIHIITIPPNWQTQDWSVVVPQLTLARGTKGLHVGKVHQCYKRFGYHQPLRCVIYAARPESSPVQAFKLW